MMNYIKCTKCGAIIISNKRKFCPKCSKNKIKMNETNCEICKTKIYSQYKNIKCCSELCKKIYYRKQLDLFRINSEQYIERLRFIYRYEHTCQYCKKIKREIDLHVHHIQPKKYGGDNGDNNLLLLCKTCHAKIHRFGKILEYMNEYYKYVKYPQEKMITLNQYNIEHQI